VITFMPLPNKRLERLETTHIPRLLLPFCLLAMLGLEELDRCLPVQF